MFTFRRFWVFTCILSALGLFTLAGCLMVTVKNSASRQLWVLNPHQDTQRCCGPVEIELESGDGHAWSGSITLRSYLAGQWKGDTLTVDLQSEHLPDGGLWLRFTCSPPQVKWLTGADVKQPVTYEAYFKVVEAEKAHFYWRDLTHPTPPGGRPGPPDPEVQPNARFLMIESTK